MSGSAFMGLHIARTGLFINQTNLNITGKNIVNATTEGYTRQRVLSVPAAYDQGVQFINIEQIRDSFLDYQYRSESSSLGELQVKTNALTSMVDFFQEPSDYGLNKVIDDFFNSVQEMSNQPESYEMRSQVRQNALNMTDTLHYLYNKFIELQQNNDREIQTTVSQINGYASSIKELNEQIVRQEVKGQNANELRDQRNLLIDKLSALVNISTTESSDGSVSVSIGGNVLVDKSNLNLLKVVKDKANPIEGESMLNSIRWEATNENVSISGGTLKGYLDVRDGKGITEVDDPKAMGIPYFVDKLNTLTKAVVKIVNDIHTAGYTMPNVTNGNASQTGIIFFEPTDIDNEVSAKNIKVSSYITDHVFNIASSDVPITDLNKGNNIIISKLSDLRNKTDLTINVGGKDYYIGNFLNFSKEIASEIALEASKSNNKLEGQEIISKSVSDRRSSVSGVSIDEELSNMIQFQHAYSAAARMISAIDENLDILINRL